MALLDKIYNIVDSPIPLTKYPIIEEGLNNKHLFYFPFQPEKQTEFKIPIKMTQNR